MVRHREAGGINLSDHDLRQLDETYLGSLTEAARALLGKALADLKAARERLGQNPSNSSRPPSTRAPWEQADADAEVPAAPGAEAGDDGDDGGVTEERAPEERERWTTASGSSSGPDWSLAR